MSGLWDSYDFERDPFGVRDKMTFVEGKTWQGPVEAHLSQSSLMTSDEDYRVAVDAVRQALSANPNLALDDTKTVRTLHQQSGLPGDAISFALFVIRNEQKAAGIR